jgi:hypothetical protein
MSGRGRSPDEVKSQGTPVFQGCCERGNPVSDLRYFFMEDDVGLFSKDIKTMDGLLLHGLQDIYYAEQQMNSAMTMSSAS